MARRENELFIGIEHLNDEGRTIKHPSLIKLYANINSNKIREQLINLISLDLETDAAKGDLKLLGVWDGNRYSYYTENFIIQLFKLVKYAKRKDRSIAYWNRLDPFVILKEFLRFTDDAGKTEALSRFGKISGEYDNKNLEWIIHPVIDIKIGDYHFGIIQAIRSSIQFYYYQEGFNSFNKVWAYDIAQLYEKGLEAEATSRFEYYSKVDKTAHLVDWNRFDNDNDYKENIVLKSNKLDCMACYDLGIQIQNDFKTAFGYYPRTLISQGSLARSAIVANLNTKYNNLDDKQRKFAVNEEIKSIGIMNYYDAWTNRYGQDIVKDLYSLVTEAYSGGYIEAIRYGYANEGYYTDIASAYPAIIQNLYDLRNAKITTGTGTPPIIDNSYCFVRGIVNIPAGVNFHPITVKHPIHKETNIRATGTYRASYTINERIFLLELGATFEDETWYNIETTGEKSTLAKVCMEFIDLRKKFLAEKNSSQYMAKIAANSLYGILFEAVDTYEEEKIKTLKDGDFYSKTLKNYFRSINLSYIKSDLKYHYGKDYLKIYNRWNKKDGMDAGSFKQELETFGIYIEADNEVDIIIEANTLYEKDIEEENNINVYRAGYRAGEFWNPLYASIITSETRLLMSRAATAIENKGGKVILMMTDSLFWTGAADMLPKEYIKEVKTLGYFEKVSKVTDIVCLGSGRYGYRSSNGYYVAKKRGLNTATIHDPNGMDETEFNWHEALKYMEKQNSYSLNINVRTLISPGLVLHNSNYNFNDLGRIVEETREVDAIVGKYKRLYDESFKEPKILAKQLVNTQPIYLLPNMTGKGVMDQTLSDLRSAMMAKKIITRHDKKKQYTNNRVKKHYSNNSNFINDKSKSMYAKLKALGYTRDEARRMIQWSDERIYNQIKEDGYNLNSI